jgi:hypothetical protein
MIYKKYKGKWVALKSDEKTVVASGINAKTAYEKAVNGGFRNPILSYVPAKLMSRIGLIHAV